MNMSKHDQIRGPTFASDLLDNFIYGFSQEKLNLAATKVTYGIKDIINLTLKFLLGLSS